MSARTDIIEIRQITIARARVVMRVIEMADVSQYRDLACDEQFALRMVRAHYVTRMRRLLATMPPGLTAQILSASEKTSGVVTGFSQN
jgi:hypothetical protein